MKIIEEFYNGLKKCEVTYENKTIVNRMTAPGPIDAAVHAFIAKSQESPDKFKCDTSIPYLSDKLLGLVLDLYNDGIPLNLLDAYLTDAVENLQGYSALDINVTRELINL